MKQKFSDSRGYNIKLFFYKSYRSLRRNLLWSLKPQFEQRILERRKIFWNDPDHNYLIKTKLNTTDPIEKWTRERNWQQRLENKHNAKEFALKYNCKVAKVLWQGDKTAFFGLDLKTFPENFTLKPLIGEGTKDVFLMRNGFNFFDAKNYTLVEMREKVNEIFNKRPGTEILIEEFLPNENGEVSVPNDYRFYAFNGVIGFIQLDKRKGFQKDQVSFYTENWELIQRKILQDASTKHYDNPPKCLEEMVFFVKRLSRVYRNFVRIDFYATNRGAVFGEFTATPRRGQDSTPYGNRKLLKLWDEHCRGLI